jgi:hypothetical protein
MGPRGILLGVAGLWSAIIAGTVVLLLVRGDPEPGNEPAPPPSHLTCASLQDRAERCEKRLVTAAGELVESESRRQGRSSFSAATRRLVAEGYLRDWIRKERIAPLCQRHRGSQLPAVQRLREALKRCWPHRGCQNFVSCLVRAARAEIRAGHLTL